ncbi:Folylpolyglutamate synthase mitochondrial, partial [Fasciolopsis buskii]
ALKVLDACVPISVVKAADGNLQKERCSRSLTYLSALGISEEQLKQLNVIHVAGSKGKGSTCCTIENILRHSGFKTGFLSSPHLINVEERIRINGRPIERQLFADLFWSIQDQLIAFTKSSGVPMPGYLHYIILMACKTFIDQKVDAAIIEVGMGGRFDHTNFFSTPAVSVVTHLCLEHTAVLGSTLAEIAWRKAGIFKPHCYAVVSRDQTEEVMQVFEREASVVHCPLFVAPGAEKIRVIIEDIDDRNSYNDNNLNREKLTTCLANMWKTDCPDGTAPRLFNMELSLAAVHLWMQYRKGILSQASGLQPSLSLIFHQKDAKTALKTHWPGRWQKVYRKDAVYYIDGAHTDDSVQNIAEWFQSSTRPENESGSALRVLIFTVLGPRDPQSMLESLHRVVQPGFDMALFLNPHPPGSVLPASKESQHEHCLTCWLSLNPNATGTNSVTGSLNDLIHLVHWIDSAPRLNRDYLLDFIRVRENSFSTVPTHRDPPEMVNYKDTKNNCHVLITGSLYLVGNALKVSRFFELLCV